MRLIEIAGQQWKTEPADLAILPNAVWVYRDTGGEWEYCFLAASEKEANRKIKEWIHDEENSIGDGD